jgi:acyl-CoA synthetase (AMP-forming)/AMP-acid ligase II
VLLVYPPSLDFILAFIACLKAALIAVPVFPPDPRRLDKGLAMFDAIATSSGATCALTSASYNYASKLAYVQVSFPSLLLSI